MNWFALLASTAAVLALVPPPLVAQQQASPIAAAPVGAKAPTSQPSGTWPKTMADAKAEAATKAAGPQSFPQSEILIAQARCSQLLKGLDVIAVPEPAFRQGECGAPAPVRLISVGRKPEVALNPPPLVTCDMAAGMHQWIKDVVQPRAKQLLGAEIIAIETMSDYSCRHAYGRTRNKLSEHGRANAIDIRSFTTARGAVAVLLEDWGLTQRDIAAQVAAAKAAAERVAAEKAAVEKAAAAMALTRSAPAGRQQPAVPVATTAQQGLAPSLIARPSIIDGLPGRGAANGTGLAAADSAGGGGGRSQPRSSLSEPQRLGGPKQALTTHNAPDAQAGRTRFLREIHTGACRIFGTVLGPEANNAHRNHFHLDMAERKSGNFCE